MNTENRINISRKRRGRFSFLFPLTLLRYCRSSVDQGWISSMQMIPRDSLNPKRRCQPGESGTTRGVRLHPGAVKVQPNTRTGSPMRQEKKCPFFDILKNLGEHWPVKGLAFLARGDQSREQHRNQRVRR